MNKRKRKKPSSNSAAVKHRFDRPPSLVSTNDYLDDCQLSKKLQVVVYKIEPHDQKRVRASNPNLCESIQTDPGKDERKFSLKSSPGGGTKDAEPHLESQNVGLEMRKHRPFKPLSSCN